ncbi:FAD binding domain-containing protein [Ditylenchus destructor]|uniref:FAD binding domain-containing protein n=1 Tax=Ditylenchus destructor TaxID=166010 RepID=A0AAD4MZR4_9BILA|nr:FAD binding domain-containing protein [Ditylenchus destructor]
MKLQLLLPLFVNLFLFPKVDAVFQEASGPLHLRASGLAQSQAPVMKTMAARQSVQADVAAAKPSPIFLHNWGGNFRFSTQNIQYPTTVEEVQQIVQNAEKVRVMGTRHSFSTIADSPDTILSTLALKNIIGFDADVPSVTVQAGITYTDLNPYLQYLGYALPNQASLAEISVAGASQTGAHGSGLAHQCLATHIRSLQIVLPNGTLATYGPNDSEIKALALGVGAFGVITQVELNVEPTFNITDYVFLDMPTQNLYDNFDKLENMGYSVQLLTDFSNPDVWGHIIVMDRSGSNSNIGNMQSLYGATRATEKVRFIEALPPPYTMNQGVEQPWYFGLVDYHLGLSGFDGAEIQTEYFVPYENAVPAIKAVSTLSDLINPRVYVMLIRTIKGDDLWLSEMYSQSNVVGIHCTWKPNMTAVMEVLPQLEELLKPYGAKPHWGKVFVQGPETFLCKYPKLAQFKALAEQLDPTHKFRNDFLEENVFANVTCPNCADRVPLIAISQQNTTILTDTLQEQYNTWTASQKLGFNSVFNQVRKAIWDDVTFPNAATKITNIVQYFLGYNKNDVEKQNLLMNITIDEWPGTIREFCDCGPG